MLAWASKKMPLMTPALFQMSLRMMKPGFMPTMWKPKLNPVNESLGSPRPKKARQVRSNIKSMLICFFDQKGIVHKEIVPPGQTVNGALYVEILKHLRENVRRKRPDQWLNNTWLLHHDNAPSWLNGFWLITTRLWCHILPTHPILHPATFSYFQNWKWSLRGEDFRCWRKFKQSRRPSWTYYK